MADKNELATTASDPSELIRFALEKGADLDKLEKLLEIRERYEKSEAVKAYNQAMAMFKANAPKINKDKEVSFGTTKYNHATLYNVTEKINTELAKWGLSASWKTAQNGLISVTCRITHKQGHFEETTISAPADKSGSKNDIQSIGSTITYLERYTLLALTGLATVDQDDDGATATELITKEELNGLIDQIAAKDINIPKFCGYLKIESLEKMPKSKLKQAKVAIEAKK